MVLVSVPTSYESLATNLKILCFSRLLLSILLGLIHGFFLASLLRCSIEMVVVPFLLLWPFEFVRRLFPFRRTVSLLNNRPWGPYKVLLIILVFYHCKLVMTSTSYYFVIIFPLFTGYTFYEECFCINAIHLTQGSAEVSKELITFVKGQVEMNGMLKIALIEKFAFLKVKILDFAGDKDYLAYHHLFLRSQAVNVIVFNMAKFAENNFKEIYAGIERLQFWIESVVMYHPKYQSSLLELIAEPWKRDV